MATLEDVVDYHFAVKRRSATTAENYRRRWRRLEREGFDWQRFMRDHKYAESAVLGYLAARRRDQSSDHAVRSDLKAINWVAMFCNHNRPPKWTVWQLPPEPRTTPSCYSPDQAEALLTYRHLDPIIQARRLALLELHSFIGLRPLEMGRLDVDDLDPEGWVLNRRPAKYGRKRHLPFPARLIEPGGSLHAWLQVRPVPPDDPGALWTTNRSPGRTHPMRIAPDRLHQEFTRVRAALGFPVSATRMRRYRWNSVFHATGKLGLAAYGLGDTEHRAQVYLTRLSREDVREALESAGLLE